MGEDVTRREPTNSGSAGHLPKEGPASPEPASSLRKLTPIETRYKGYRFRSRLEARWAVFFDALGVEWRYEPEGFKLPSGCLYLPDFFLPTVSVRGYGHGTWFEVKPTRESDHSLAEEFASPEGYSNSSNENGLNVVVLIGEPDVDESANIQLGPWWDEGVGFMRCYQCDHLAIQFFESYPCPRCNAKADWNHPSLIKAQTASRAARFEHGESA